MGKAVGLPHSKVPHYCISPVDVTGSILIIAACGAELHPLLPPGRRQALSLLLATRSP